MVRVHAVVLGLFFFSFGNDPHTILFTEYNFSIHMDFTSSIEMMKHISLIFKIEYFLKYFDMN
jgi:hypothetical protein